MKLAATLTYRSLPLALRARSVPVCRFLTRLAVSLGLLLSAVSSVTTGVQAQVGADVRFASKERAFVQGYSAFKGRNYDIAVPALKFAAEQNLLRAKYYLARIYSDNSGGFTDHARAYRLLQQIVAGAGRVDPKDYRMAPYISRALTSIARYERDGVRSLNLKANTRRALAYFDQAATFYNDPDAQFELAKHYLAGDGVEPRVPDALNWLAGLSKRGHAGAQAFLANLYWDGRYVTQDRVRSLALITVAVENANDEDRFWIEDVHQNIFCESDQRTRTRVHGVVDGWRRRFARASTVSDSYGDQLGPLGLETKRICANGDFVGDLMGVAGRQSTTAAAPLPKLREPDAVATASGEATRPVEPQLEGQARNPSRASASGFQSLNGFRFQEAGASVGSAAPYEPSERKAASSSDTTASDVPPANRRRPVNGLTMQGQSGFGFSVLPGNR